MKSSEEIQGWVSHILGDLRPWPDGAVNIRARLEPKPREASTAVIASIHTEHAEDLAEVGAKVARAVWLLDAETLPDTLDMRIEFIDGSGKAIPGGRTMRLQNVRPAVAVEPARRPPVPVATVAQPPILDVEQLPSGPPLMARVQQASAQMTAGLPDQVDRASVALLHQTHLFYGMLMAEQLRAAHHETRLMSAENRMLTGEVRENTSALRGIVEGRDETNSDLIALTIKSKADAAAADAQAELAHRVGLDEGRAEGRAEGPSGAPPKPSKLMEGMQLVKEAASTIGQARAAMADAATLQAKAEAMTGAGAPTDAAGLLRALLARPKDELIGALDTLPPEVHAVVGAIMGGGA